MSSEPELPERDFPTGTHFAVAHTLQECCGNMQTLRVLSVTALALACLLARPAFAVTPDELVELTRSGLGDEVLLALIETTGVPEPVDAAAVLALKQAGVGERVIAAAVRASRPAQPEPAANCPDCDIGFAGDPYSPAPPDPALVALEREVYREVYVYVPVVVGPPVRPSRHRPAKPYFEGDRGFGRFINEPVTLPRSPKADGRR